MAKNEKKKSRQKPAVKVEDLSPQQNPTGGKTQTEYLVVKLKEVFVTNVTP